MWCVFIWNWIIPLIWFALAAFWWLIFIITLFFIHVLLGFTLLFFRLVLLEFNEVWLSNDATLDRSFESRGTIVELTREIITYGLGYSEIVLTVFVGAHLVEAVGVCSRDSFQIFSAAALWSTINPLELHLFLSVFWDLERFDVWLTLLEYRACCWWQQRLLRGLGVQQHVLSGVIVHVDNQVLLILPVLLVPPLDEIVLVPGLLIWSSVNLVVRVSLPLWWWGKLIHQWSQRILAEHVFFLNVGTGPGPPDVTEASRLPLQADVGRWLEVKLRGLVGSCPKVNSLVLLGVYTVAVGIVFLIATLSLVL